MPSLAASEERTMAKDAPSYAVLTDMHFGTPESRINEEGPRTALVAYLSAGAPWDEIIFAGDLLDMNLSTLTRSLEGGASSNSNTLLCGFRSFLGQLDESMAGRGGLAAIARRWVYVPGNHDYRLWDLLATRVACEDVLANSQPMGKIQTPVVRHAWHGTSSFLSGVFRKAGAYDVRDAFSVEYPDHRITLGADLMVVTHGHYLDASQTRFSDLSEAFPPGTPPEVAAARIRQLFKETAQYQAVATAVSYTRDTTKVVSDLFGPAGLANKVKKVIDGVRGWLAAHLYSGIGSRGEGLSGRWLRNIDTYIEYVFANDEPPRRVRWFVFGHTHVQGTAKTPGGVEAFNAGSCYGPRSRPITFIEIVATQPPSISLKGVERQGAAWTVI